MKNVGHSTPEFSDAQWRASSYSGGQGNCVEIADSNTGPIPVRDSKRPDGPVIRFSSGAWREFLAFLR